MSKCHCVWLCVVRELLQSSVQCRERDVIVTVYTNAIVEV